MRVLLVNPPFSGIYHRLGFVFPPLGIAYLAAYLRSADLKVDLVDLAVTPSGLDILTRHKYDLVGISGDSCRHNSALEIALEVKKEGGSFTVLGGPHATYQDREILEADQSIDFVIRREGELTLLELARTIAENGSPDEIQGLSFRDERGTFMRNEDRAFIRDLDQLPLPARDLLPMDQYRTLELRRRKITPVVTSRGCPFQCPFCCSSEFAGTVWRTHSVERVISEIELMQSEYNFGAIAFIDDTFTIDMRRVQKIARAILEKGLDIRWWCFSRPDIILQRTDIVQEMAASGARYVFMGLESGEEGILNRLKKGVNRSKGAQAIELLRTNGIETMASYMFGDLTETEESIQRTISFARSLPTGAAQFSILTPFPGTLIWSDYAPLLLHQDWACYDCTQLVFKHPHLSVERAHKLHIQAYRRYYLTFGRILRGLLSFVRGKGVKLSKILPVLKFGQRE